MKRTGAFQRTQREVHQRKPNYHHAQKNLGVARLQGYNIVSFCAARNALEVVKVLATKLQKTDQDI